MDEPADEHFRICVTLAHPRHSLAALGFGKRIDHGFDIRLKADRHPQVNGAHGSDWSDEEVDAIVADYFLMLADELAGRPFNKALHNRGLQQLTGRTHGSIERKHQNISAVLERIGIRMIEGYKPLPHFQNALVASVERYLALNGEPMPVMSVQSADHVAEAESLWIGPPPQILPADKIETERLRQLVRRFDPAQRDARNRELGRRGEELVFHHEQQWLASRDRDDLASRVEWTSEVRGDGAGYDIRSFEPDGRERLIEVKTTNGPAKTPFFISENERAFSEERPDAFCLLRLYSFSEKPSAFILRPPLTDSLLLRAASYRASLISN